MLNAAPRPPAPYNVRTFRAFLDGRPSEERWELIEGYPMQSAAPRIGHQRIASNFERHLNQALRARKPEWRADREIGIEVAEESNWRPEPEVTVIDRNVDPDQTYADRFYLVMEVPSQSDRGWALEGKVAFYRRHPSNRFIVIVDQDKVEVTLHRRSRSDRWTAETLRAPDEPMILGELGAICTVGDLYENTRFDPELCSRLTRSVSKGGGRVSYFDRCP